MTKYTKDDCGCYVDGAKGIYAGLAIQGIATAYGWIGDHANPTDEEYFDAEDEATDYMQTHYSVDGCYWGRNDNGDWGLWKIDEQE